jgi:hypothetical protein
MEAFTIYDYKFGFDPSDEEHFMEDYSFSVGGKSQNALESAKALGFEVVNKGMMDETTKSHFVSNEEADEDDTELKEYINRQWLHRAGIIK